MTFDVQEKARKTSEFGLTSLNLFEYIAPG